VENPLRLEHPLMNPVHRFHIPVMGTGFTIDTPLKVARYGISSVVSLVDDVLIEQMRRRLHGLSGEACEPIDDDADDSRARRITAYLDLLDSKVEEQFSRLRDSVFEKGSEITRYCEMLPESPLKGLWRTMQTVADPAERERLQNELRARIRPGAIDVNIMTKLDRERRRRGQMLPPVFADAMSALRGYAQSRLRSSLVLSAGLNRRLYAYLAEFDDFFPDSAGDIRKRIILKVSDFRSALVQGKLLARQGLWVSEYRIESGLNCGGHAFGGRGHLLGPVLDDFRQGRDALREQLQGVFGQALEMAGRAVPEARMDFRVTVQGGIGTAEEDALLAERYGVDGTGWASPFLLVPEAVNIDAEHLSRILAAGEDDVHLSDASPLGVPFWCLKTSASEEDRRRRIAEGRPGSDCPKGFLMSNTEFTKAPICTASRNYQRRKLASLEAAAEGGVPAADAEAVTAKACICHDLAGSATLPHEIDPAARTAVCCGPNTVYFARAAALHEMIDHIYGRLRLPLKLERPHMLLKELALHLDQLRKERDCACLTGIGPSSLGAVRDNLAAGIAHYRELAGRLAGGLRDEFVARLDRLQGEFESLRD
jgi:hypothetical protein